MSREAAEAGLTAGIAEELPADAFQRGRSNFCVGGTGILPKRSGVGGHEAGSVSVSGGANQSRASGTVNPIKKAGFSCLNHKSTERKWTWKTGSLPPDFHGGDDETEYSLRPKTLAEYIGQDKAKENLSIYIERLPSAVEKRWIMYCFTGPPGLGKTTLSQIIANEMNTNIKVTSGPAIEKPGDLAALLTNLSRMGMCCLLMRSTGFPRRWKRVLYPAMEDYALDIIIGKGPSARSIRLDLKKFTLVGATTRAGQLTSPLRDRFGVILRLELYTPEQLCDIILRSAGILNIPCDREGAMELARRSRGTPRIANRLLKRVREFCRGYRQRGF